MLEKDCHINGCVVKCRDFGGLVFFTFYGIWSSWSDLEDKTRTCNPKIQFLQFLVFRIFYIVRIYYLVMEIGWWNLLLQYTATCVKKKIANTYLSHLLNVTLACPLVLASCQRTFWVDCDRTGFSLFFAQQYHFIHSRDEKLVKAGKVLFVSLLCLSMG